MNIKIPTFIIFCFCTAFLLGVNIDINFDDQTDITNTSLSIGFTTVLAYDSNRGVARRTARRTANRVNRRHDYYRSLPDDCIKVIINGSVYYECGGIHYAQSRHDNDVTYIIINP